MSQSEAQASAEPGHRGGLAEFVDSVRRLLRRKERVSMGAPHLRGGVGPAADIAIPLSAFKMIGLDAVRERLGERWPALAEKVHQIAYNTIAKHLIRGDVFERQGEDGYLVLFASLGPAEAEFKSRIISREITEHLLGDAETAALGVQAHCTEISAAELAHGDPEALMHEALARAADPASAEEALRRTADDEAGANRLPPAPGEEEERGRLGGLKEQRPSDEAADASQTHHYSPVWDVAQMTLLRFRAFSPEVLAPARSDPASLNQAFQADVNLIQAVTRDLRDLSDHGRRLPVTLAIQHASLGSGSQRTRLREALAETPGALRKLITLEICWPQEEFWTYACKAFLESTQPLGLSWSALIPLDRPDAIPHGGALRSVDTAATGFERDEAEAMHLMRAFAGRARSLGLTSGMYGLATRALVLGAVGAGMRFLSGAAIHADVAHISHAMRFEPLDLYAEMIAAGA